MRVSEKMREERVRKGQVHMSPADKGKGMVVMSVIMYEEIVSRHARKDEEVTWTDLEKAQKEV